MKEGKKKGRKKEGNERLWINFRHVYEKINKTPWSIQRWVDAIKEHIAIRLKEKKGNKKKLVKKLINLESDNWDEYLKPVMCKQVNIELLIMIRLFHVNSGEESN